MKNLGSMLLLLVVLSLVFAGFANAQATRTWVSGVGDDANPCSRTAPCKTFAGSISKTATGGEINCLDPGGFGAVTITKSISIDCGMNGYTGGSVLVSAGSGVNVNAPSTAVVTLRNLSIQGLSAGTIGVNFINGGTLHVENVKIIGFTTSCIDVSAGGNTRLTVENSTLTECGTNGISVAAASGGSSLCDIHNVRIWFPGTNGINAGNSSRFSINNADIFFATNGINMANATTGNGAIVNLVSSTLYFNTTALLGSAASTMVTSRSTFFYNSLVFGSSGIYTTGDNVLFLNTLTGTAPSNAGGGLLI